MYDILIYGPLTVYLGYLLSEPFSGSLWAYGIEVFPSWAEVVSATSKAPHAAAFDAADGAKLWPCGILSFELLS